ncbi:response regulator transcription factor [Granulicella sp. L60]|uniref:response regulator transcription factor n=1 Tax=Granulicella sp. L60 TaxID=1641866 RepID=UPI00131AC90F|nr:response regulator transcription factor [Granulicella sp. L60]
MKSLLLVDDEPVISAELQKALQKSRYHVELVEDVASAQRLVETSNFDLIIVELNLKEDADTPAHPANGAGLVRQFRAAGINVPILIHSALSDDFVQMASLDAGADEYIVKRSASFRVLLARIQAHFRRDERLLHPRPSHNRWVGTRDFRLDREERKLSVGHVSIELNVRETKVMDMLTSNPLKVFSGEEIMKKVWGSDIRRSSATLESLLYRLRLKFKEHQIQDLIENVRDEGYRLAVSSVTQL